MTCGIYKIYCDSNNRTYIGSSNNIERRFKEHLGDLRNNRHSNQYLQNSYNKYGEEITTYPSILEASRVLKVDPKTIRKKLKGEKVVKSKLKNIQVCYGE